MIKVKIFGVLRTTIGFGYLEVSEGSMIDVFEEISKIMEKHYYEDLENQKNQVLAEGEEERNAALNPHKKLSFGDAIVYINGDRCMKKRARVKDGDEIWLLSPAAGG